MPEPLPSSEPIIDERDTRALALTHRIAYLQDALSEIKKGAGRFDLDRLKHAGNCIDNMKAIAVDALLGTWKAR